MVIKSGECWSLKKKYIYIQFVVVGEEIYMGVIIDHRNKHPGNLHSLNVGGKLKQFY